MQTRSLNQWTSVTCLFAVASSILIPIAGCATEGEEFGEAEGRQTSRSSASQNGIPKHYLGTQDLITGIVTFQDGKTEDVSTISRDMEAIPGTGGRGTRAPISCRVAEAWATASAPTFSAEQKCRVEYGGTGRLTQSLNGVSVDIIPVDSNGAGFDAARFAPTAQKLTAGALAPVVNGPVKASNSGLDSDRVQKAMAALRAKFQSMPGGVLFSFGQDCLKNARASAWTDVQAHYYCQMPYTIRYCYSTILAETKNPVQAFQYCSDASNQDDWKAKRDAMFHPYGPGGTDWDWLLQDQGDVFNTTERRGASRSSSCEG